MRLTELEVRHFRNVRHARLLPIEGVNVLWGANAQGKTNMLEAAFYLVTGRSFRTRFERECLAWKEARARWADTSPNDPAVPAHPPEPSDLSDAPDRGLTPEPPGAFEAAVIRGRLRRASGDHELLVALTPQQKRIAIDGNPIDRLGMLWGRLNAVLFTPADLAIIQLGPGQRRQFLDTTLSQVSQTYLHHLQRYSHALRQRNALLRMRRPLGELSEQFEVWEAQMAPSAIEVSRARAAHVDRLGSRLTLHYAAIAGAGGAPTPAERLSARYSGFIRSREELESPAAIDLYADRLRRSRADDAERAATFAGPHRDDIAFEIEGRDLRQFGSQGQQRSAIVALRLAEVETMTQSAGETPVLLLDDIIAELDPARTAAFLRLLAALPVQTFLTTTDLGAVEKHIAVARRWRVRQGAYDLED